MQVLHAVRRSQTILQSFRKQTVDVARQPHGHRVVRSLFAARIWKLPQDSHAIGVGILRILYGCRAKIARHTCELYDLQDTRGRAIRTFLVEFEPRETYMYIRHSSSIEPCLVEIIHPQHIMTQDNVWR